MTPGEGQVRALVTVAATPCCPPLTVASWMQRWWGFEFMLSIDLYINGNHPACRPDPAFHQRAGKRPRQHPSICWLCATSPASIGRSWASRGRGAARLGNLRRPGAGVRHARRAGQREPTVKVACRDDRPGLCAKGAMATQHRGGYPWQHWMSTRTALIWGLTQEPRGTPGDGQQGC